VGDGVSGGLVKLVDGVLVNKVDTVLMGASVVVGRDIPV
jgi:hypothetical protein